MTDESGTPIKTYPLTQNKKVSFPENSVALEWFEKAEAYTEISNGFANWAHLYEGKGDMESTKACAIESLSWRDKTALPYLTESDLSIMGNMALYAQGENIPPDGTPKNLRLAKCALALSECYRIGLGVDRKEACVQELTEEVERFLDDQKVGVKELMQDVLPQHVVDVRMNESETPLALTENGSHGVALDSIRSTRSVESEGLMNIGHVSMPLETNRYSIER